MAYLLLNWIKNNLLASSSLLLIVVAALYVAGLKYEIHSLKAELNVMEASKTALALSKASLEANVKQQNAAIQALKTTSEEKRKKVKEAQTKVIIESSQLKTAGLHIQAFKGKGTECQQMRQLIDQFRYMLIQ